MYSLPAGTRIVEEYKGSKDAWSYKRENYSIFRRWLMADYPEYTFIENIDGKIEFPKVQYPNMAKHYVKSFDKKENR